MNFFLCRDIVFTAWHCPRYVNTSISVADCSGLLHCNKLSIAQQQSGTKLQLSSLLPHLGQFTKSLQLGLTKKSKSKPTKCLKLGHFQLLELAYL